MLIFVERAAGVDEEKAIHSAHAFKTIFADMETELTNSAAGRAPPRKAPRPLLAVLLALERSVVNHGRPPFWRMYAWWKLVQTWAVLRFDDHRGMATHALKMTAEGLNILLDKTKTTGSGKRALVRPAFMSKGAYIAEPGWLESGFQLWESEAPGIRDYVLVTPVSLELVQG